MLNAIVPAKLYSPLLIKVQQCWMSNYISITLGITL